MKYETKELTIRMMSYKYRFCLRLLLVCLLLYSTQTFAEDWPTYMHDNARSGVTSETLDLEQLHQSWVYISPAPPQTSWAASAPWDPWANRSATAQLPNMRDFDSAIFVTVVGDSVYLGSSVTDSVDCLKIYNGIEQWSYTTNGPVRFPPSYYNNMLYFGSDDGNVYCINASDGSFVRKYTPIPEPAGSLASGDTRLVCNNNRLIPMWPVRTGTAVYDGKVYFASSLVPWKRPFICCANANGAEIYYATAGTANPRGDYAHPMAPILLSSTYIYLLQGRTQPQIYYRSNGNLYGTIGPHTTGGTYALLTSDASPHLIHEKGQPYAEGKDLEDVPSSSPDHLASYSGAVAMVVSASNSTAYVIMPGDIKAFNRSNGSTIWSNSEIAYGPSVIIKAGDNLFVGGTKKVVAYDVSNGNEVWSKTVTGKVRGLTAANGHLFASTDTGHIYAFGGAAGDLSGDGKIDADDLE